MRKLLGLLSILVLVFFGFAAEAATPVKKKTTPKKLAKSAVAARKNTGSPVAGSATKSAGAKRGKKTPVRHAITWRNRQLAPTPERYKEIQVALSAKGYLPAEQANGQWSDTSTAALKKFQAEQNLEANGKINSLSLIALGLGPKRETVATAKPTPAPALP